jgi:signal transduction histidine kinase
VNGQRAVEFFRLAEPRQLLSRSDRAVDAVIAVVFSLAAVWVEFEESVTRAGDISVLPTSIRGGHLIGLPHAQLAMPGVAVLSVALTTAPLVFRRRYPVTTFGVILIGVLLTIHESTVVSFAAAIFAAYSAVLYSKYRRLALTGVLAGAVIVTAAYPDTTPRVPARFTALLVLMPTVAVAIAMRDWRQRARDSAERLRLAEAGHEEQTRRAVEAERARIAGEMHDVVTHNVSVMVVQAGAARRVLGSSPGDAREVPLGVEVPLAIEALFAVEASGRTAMAELRHLLGLLAPYGTDDAALIPQPDLGQVPALVDRVRAAGLPVELTVTGARVLPPGVDLAAYRVVQEALTNVIKHANQARTAVRIEYGQDELAITVSDDGRAARASGAGGRGLIGLRERIAIYGGELDAGPRPGGGWRLRAKIPLEPAPSPGPAPGPSPAEAVGAGFQGTPT